MKYRDDMTRYRAACRTNELIKKGDTRASYNIISGNDLVQRTNPNLPKRPF